VKVVPDTNVLISAFCFPGGAPEMVYRLGIEGRLDLATSTTLLAEFGRILTDKFDWEPSHAEEAVAQVARISEVVAPVARLKVITADPADDRVLEAAVDAGADVIVSGDSHLLSLRIWEEIRIVTPADLLAEFD
jgi:putative PIN family toxin of toxin-antitoxin system